MDGSSGVEETDQASTLGEECDSELCKLVTLSLLEVRSRAF